MKDETIELNLDDKDDKNSNKNVSKKGKNSNEGDKDDENSKKFTKVQDCNFNEDGELILFREETDKAKVELGHRNLVYVYSIQDGKAKCQRMYETSQAA